MPSIYSALVGLLLLKIDLATSMAIPSLSQSASSELDRRDPGGV